MRKRGKNYRGKREKVGTADLPLDAAVKTIAGTARSMGLDVVG